MVKRQVLCAETGMVLTDGVTYGTVVYLAEGADASRFYEITKEEFERVTGEVPLT